MTMKAGELDRRITIQQNTVSAGSEYGEPQDSWTTFATVWADVVPMVGRELAQAQQISGEVTTKFIIRWLSGVQDNMRISYNSQYYDIFRVHELNRREGVEIWARARQS